MRAVGRAALFASALATAGCSTSAPQGPACTNESTAAPYGDAGILPVRSLPAGYPCATGAVCYATIDDCSDSLSADRSWRILGKVLWWVGLAA